MNILREFRRVKKRSLPARILLISIFSVILIINTYAWFNSNQPVNMSGLEANITPWDVRYYVDDKEVLDETVTFTIDELYPGMPNREDIVRIYNMSTTSTSINYEVTSVKVFGQEVLDQLKENNIMQTDGNTVHIFADDTEYPFDISYTYDRARLDGEYVDDETTPNAGATFKFQASWEYQGEGTEDENLARDILDTKFGQGAYEYYQNEENDSSKAIEITVKITSSMIHPNADT